MDDTVKLIVEISKENLKRISDGEWIGTHAYDNMILNGTPLDDVKAEINKNIINEYTGQNEYEIALSDGLELALQIIDKHIGKAESEGV